MTKSKGCPGGNKVKVDSADELKLILDYLNKEYTAPRSDFGTDYKRKNWLRKIKQFTTNANGNLCYISNKMSATCVSEPRIRIFVPDWEMNTIINQYHGAGKPGEHLGSTAIHK